MISSKQNATALEITLWTGVLGVPTAMHTYAALAGNQIKSSTLTHRKWCVWPWIRAPEQCKYAHLTSVTGMQRGAVTCVGDQWGFRHIATYP